MFHLLAASTYTYTSYNVDSGSTKGFMAFGLGVILFTLAIYAVAVIALWKVFEKAGIPSWKALVPFYNGWLLFEMAGKPGWWSLIGIAGGIPVLGFIASIAAFVLYIIAALELGKAFKQSTAFSVVGLIIFSVVGLLMLGFGDAKYTKPATAPTKFS